MTEDQLRNDHDDTEAEGESPHARTKFAWHGADCEVTPGPGADGEGHGDLHAPATRKAWDESDEPEVGVDQAEEAEKE